MNYSVIQKDKNKNCTVCNMKLDVVNYLKHRTDCKSCYNKNRRKNNNNTSRHNPRSRIPKNPGTYNLEVLELLEPRSFDY